MAETGAEERMRDPFLLSPRIQRPLEDLERDPLSGAFDADAQAWVAPFVMASINTRVVRRSCQILGTDFVYQEYLKLGGALAGPLAVGIAAGSALFGAGLRFSPFRRFLRAVAP